MYHGAIAQLEERLDRTQEVAGSSPASSIEFVLLSAGVQVEINFWRRPSTACSAQRLVNQRPTVLS
jgi:hypothetical protein